MMKAPVQRVGTYVSFASLLMLDRAVKHSRNWLTVTLAGGADHGEGRKLSLEFDDKRTAKRAGGSLLVHIREKRAQGECVTDEDYNRIVIGWVKQLEAGGYIQNEKVGDDGDGESANG